MALIVQKFGGTSVGNIERIKNVATKVKREVDAGNQVVVVVSAMSGETNKLVGFCEGVSKLTTAESLREYDSIVSSGEIVTSGLLALELQSIGIPAKSMLGWQIPIITEVDFSKARIEDIDTKRLLKELKDKVIVVPGFQGVTPEKDPLDRNVTTLGRGGSDTSAVAIAAALKADRCDIFTDVDGVYTSDPRIVPKARKLKKVGYEEVLEMASLGAKVLHSRCVELAMKYKVKTQVLSSFEDIEGTYLVEEEEVVERRLITGVTYSRNDAQVTLVGVENTPGVAAKIFGPLADAGINVDMIVQNVSKEDKKADITFTIAKTDVARAEEALKKSGLKYDEFYKNTAVVKVSVIGVGMRSHAGIAQKMFEVLAAKGINIHVISTSEIKISVLIDEEYLELAMRSLHTAYGLDAK
jgi:aspartate kinase